MVRTGKIPYSVVAELVEEYSEKKVTGGHQLGVNAQESCCIVADATA
jgi:hypothetical protein